MNLEPAQYTEINAFFTKDAGSTDENFVFGGTFADQDDDSKTHAMIQSVMDSDAFWST